MIGPFRTDVSRLPSTVDRPPWKAASQALQWAVDALCKAGTLSIIGVYPLTAERFPIGVAMNKNLTIKMGNCNHRRYIPRLIELVSTGIVDPLQILTKVEPLNVRDRDIQTV